MMISFVIPIYNSEKYLVECLQSIACQTYKNFEVIMVNDGSTDCSKQICERFCEQYPNFYLINKQNGGQMSSWLLALKHVKGDFVCFVDSDDLIEPNFLERMSIAQKKNNADLVMCSRKVFKDGFKDSMKVHKLPLTGFYTVNDKDKIRSEFLPTFHGNLSQARWDKMFKTPILKECAERYCYNPVRTFEDRFITIPYVFYSNNFEFVDEPLYLCRIVHNSSSKKFRPELCQISDQLFESHVRLLNDLQVYDQYIQRVELEKIDVLRAIFERNICVKASFKLLKNEAKKILSDTNRAIVKRHKMDCFGKFGRFFYICCKFNSPILLIIGGKFYRRAK